MGVRGLQSYIEKNCPEAMVQVNLPTIGRRYYRQYGREAVLVVDGMSCLRKLYHPRIPWIYGGQWKEYLQELKQFVISFQRARIRLVFFFDGRVETDKRAVWVQRRLTEREKMAKIFDFIKHKKQEPDESLFHIPVNLSSITIQVLKSMGVVVFNSTKEADYEIAKYCQEFQCLGILGQDTDYIIYNIGEYFSSQYLDTRSLITVSYSREALCHRIGIPIFQLPLLASLLGNDFIPRHDLVDFHQELARGRVPGFPKLIELVADYVAYYGTRLLDDSDFQELDSYVFRDHSKFGLISKSVRNYYMEEETEVLTDGEPKSQTVTQAVLRVAEQQHVEAENTVSVFNVMVVAEVDSGMSFEDESDASLPSSALLLKPIRERMYGLIFGVGSAKNDEQSGALMSELSVKDDNSQFQRGSTNTGSEGRQELIVGVNAVKEWCVYRGNDLQQPDIVPALPLDSLDGRTPTLDYLWLQEGAQVEEDRLRAYLACMDCTISMATIRQIPPELVVPCTIFHYFIKHLDEDVFTVVELKAFLAVSVCVAHYDADRLYNLEVSSVDAKAVHFATVYMRCIRIALTVNCACGKPIDAEDVLPWKYFDGKLFHEKYIAAQQGASDSFLCDRIPRTTELFHTLQQFVVEGTRLESSAGSQ